MFFNPYNQAELWVTSFGHGLMVGSTKSLPGTLQINGSAMKQNGTVVLTLQPATPGASYALQSSTNLANWAAVGTNAAASNGVVQFNDTNAGGISRRFYRSQSL